MNKLTNHEIENRAFDDVVEDVETLLAISSGDLSMESMKFVHIFTTLSRYNRIHSKKLLRLMQLKDKLVVKLQKHYGGKMTAEHYKQHPLPVIPDKKDIDKWIRADDLMVEMEELVRDQEHIVSLIEDAMKQANNRGYAIKNAIDYQRLMQEGK